MTHQTIFGLALLALIAPSLSGCSKAGAQEAAESGRDIELTVYKQDFALIHESRSVELNPGRNQVRFDNVSKSLDPNTILFDQSGEAGPEINSQRVDLGVSSGESLLTRLEGKRVEMLWNRQDGQPHERIEGTLESTQAGGFVLRSGDKLYVNPPGTIVAPTDFGLAARPQISAEIDSPKKSEPNLGFAYQTRGMSWSADYSGRLSSDGTSLDLECWATVENHTGIEYPDAKITLVAGSPNRAVMAARSRKAFDDETAAAKMPMAASPMSIPETVGELYAYPVPARATIGQDQVNRVKILHQAKVPIRNDYSVRLGVASAYAYDDSGTPSHRNAQLSISFVNDSASGLDVPLPAGAVRLYADHAPDSPVYIGASGIGDTAKDEKVILTLSNVFDVTVDSKPTKTQRLGKHTIRKSFEAVIHNAKEGNVEVRVVQSFYGQPKFISESTKGQMLDSATRQWRISVPSRGVATLTWTADFQN